MTIRTDLTDSNVCVLCLAADKSHHALSRACKHILVELCGRTPIPFPRDPGNATTGEGCGQTSGSCVDPGGGRVALVRPSAPRVHAPSSASRVAASRGAGRTEAPLCLLFIAWGLNSTGAQSVLVE